MSRHSNIAIFVPHSGCNHRCSFCNQNSITGILSQPTADDVVNAVKTAVKSKNYSAKDTEIAFFGGSFTAIDKDYMLSLLNAAEPFVKDGTVKGIRISTRPDAIDEEILSLLKVKGVTAIELGAQSMVDEVLLANRRGHTANKVLEASQLIKQNGFSLGLQMMTGLYKDTDNGARYTAEEICKLQPDTVRIYPAITLKGTQLASLYKSGEYLPQTLESAVELCSELLNQFEKEGIKVIRLGLHSITEEDFIAGPWHPAFRELCESKLYLKAAKEKLKKQGNYTLFVRECDISKMVGQSRKNIEFLKEIGYNCNVKGEPSLRKYEVKIKESV